MNQTAHATPTSPEAHDTNALLRRVLDAVEGNTRRGRLELVLAIIMSLGTLASTWCGYQANLWAGNQMAQQAESSTADRQAAEDTLAALQLRTFDGITLLAYWEAFRAGNTEVSEGIFARMRPSLQRAIQASIAAGVLHDPTVAGPLHRPEYVLEEEERARTLRADAHRLQAEAAASGRASGSYVLLTIMFASVLFFGGITGTFTARRVRVGLGWISLLLFVITMILLARLPIAAG
jgi:hypothetical protein